MKLRILHTESSCGWGGQELRILTESQGMIERGHEVHLVADPSSRIAECGSRYGLDVATLPIRTKSMLGLMAMRRLIAVGNFDVINSHSSTDSWLAGLAAASLTDAPPIVRTRHISAPFENNFLTRWIYGRACAAVVTTGEALRRDLIQTLGVTPAKVVSVPTGIDTETFRPADAMERAALRARLGLPDYGLLLGIVATLRSWKGHADLIDALDSIPEGGMAGDWHLAIVGDGPQKENLLAQRERLGMHGRITMAGHQDHPADWFRSLDVFCLPSYANEGVPQALMQAMACALPCLTTTAGAIPEAVQHMISGLVVAPRNTTALTEAVEQLGADEELRARLGGAARERALSHFGRERMIDRMEELFSSVVAGPPIKSGRSA